MFRRSSSQKKDGLRKGEKTEARNISREKNLSQKKQDGGFEMTNTDVPDRFNLGHLKKKLDEYNDSLREIFRQRIILVDKTKQFQDKINLCLQAYQIFQNKLNQSQNGLTLSMVIEAAKKNNAYTSQADGLIALITAMLNKVNYNALPGLFSEMNIVYSTLKAQLNEFNKIRKEISLILDDLNKKETASRSLSLENAYVNISTLPIDEQIAKLKSIINSLQIFIKEKELQAANEIQKTYASSSRFTTVKRPSSDMEELNDEVIRYFSSEDNTFGNAMECNMDSCEKKLRELHQILSSQGLNELSAIMEPSIEICNQNQSARFDITEKENRRSSSTLFNIPIAQQSIHVSNLRPTYP